MLKKEWRDISLPVLLRLLIGPVLVVVSTVFAGKVEAFSALLFLIVYVVSILWVALHMGLNTFRSEFHDHAFEYLLTFPFRRSRLLAAKFASRFSILAFLIILYILFLGIFRSFSLLPASKFANSPLLNSLDLSFLAISYFIIGFFLSLVDWGSARPAIPLVIIAGHSILAILLVRSMGDLGRSAGGLVLSGILLMIAMGVFFNISFRRLLRGNLGNDWNRSSKKSLSLVVCKKNGRNWGLLRYETWIIARNFFLYALFAPVLVFVYSKVQFTIKGQPHRFLDPAVSIAAIAASIIILFAFDSGIRSFYSEFRYKALEYLLTFPLSLRRILFEKLMARIFVLIPAIIAYMIFAGHFSERLALGSGFFYIFLRPEFFPFWVALMFVNGFFLSLFEMKNIMALVSLADFFTIVFVPLAVTRIMKRLSMAIAPQAMTALIIGSGLLLTTLILAIAFFKLLNSFDLDAPRRYSKVFGWSLFTTFTILSLAGLTVVLFV